jgi:hypothetical protein
VWTLFRAGKGSLGPVIEGADVGGGLPLAVYWGEETTNRCLLKLEAIPNAYDEIDEGGAITPWPAGYTTGWKHLGWPELRKSWRRPRFIVRSQTDDIGLRIESFRDYDESNPIRVHQLFSAQGGTPYWRGTMDSGPWLPPWNDPYIYDSGGGAAGPINEGHVIQLDAFRELDVSIDIERPDWTTPGDLIAHWGGTTDLRLRMRDSLGNLFTKNVPWTPPLGGTRVVFRVVNRADLTGELFVDSSSISNWVHTIDPSATTTADLILGQAGDTVYTASILNPRPAEIPSADAGSASPLGQGFNWDDGAQGLVRVGDHQDRSQRSPGWRLRQGEGDAVQVHYRQRLRGKLLGNRCHDRESDHP